jgi:hypothetical protein
MKAVISILLLVVLLLAQAAAVPATSFPAAGRALLDKPTRGCLANFAINTSATSVESMASVMGTPVLLPVMVLVWHQTATPTTTAARTVQSTLGAHQTSHHARQRAAGLSP